MTLQEAIDHPAKYGIIDGNGKSRQELAEGNIVLPFFEYKDTREITVKILEGDFTDEELESHFVVFNPIFGYGLKIRKLGFYKPNGCMTVKGDLVYHPNCIPNDYEPRNFRVLDREHLAKEKQRELKASLLRPDHPEESYGETERYFNQLENQYDR